MNWVTMVQASVGDFRRRVLHDWNWVWKKGESWAIVGPNGSGKSALAAFLLGQLDLVSGNAVVDSVFSDDENGWIGFARQKKLLEYERRIDESEWSESPDPGTLLEAFVDDDEAVHQFGLGGKEKRGLKQLSTGELRRASLARAWARKVPVWVLDDPYEGLDKKARDDFKELFDQLLNDGQTALFLTRRPEDIPDSIQKILVLENGKISFQGQKTAWGGNPAWLAPDPSQGTGIAEAVTESVKLTSEIVIEFTDVTAGYGSVNIFQNFNWTVRAGESWQVRGPNGSGKSTLLALIAGEHPQVFSNDIRLFGLRRGVDLTLFSLKRRIAHLSYAVHNEFRNLFDVKAIEIVVSGFYDSIGLYREPFWEHVRLAREMMKSMGIEEDEGRLWEELSWGRQRLVLLARALVKGPELLLLDEPCQGLDFEHQSRFLERVDELARSRRTTLLYVTHRQDEIRSSHFKVLDLGSTEL